MEIQQNAEFDLDKVLNQAKEEATAPESQPESEPVNQEGGDENQNQIEKTEEEKKNAKTRIQELLRDRKEKEEQIENLKSEFNQFRKEFEERKSTATHPDGNIPSWFVKLYGFNEEAWKVYEQGTKETLESYKKEILNETLERVKREQTEEYQKQTAIQRQINDYADEHNIDSSELRKFASDYPIFKQDGNFDFDKISEIAKLKKGTPAKSNARKELASIRNSNADNKPKEFFTPRDFRF